MRTFGPSMVWSSFDRVRSLSASVGFMVLVLVARLLRPGGDEDRRRVPAMASVRATNAILAELNITDKPFLQPVEPVETPSVFRALFVLRFFVLEPQRCLKLLSRVGVPVSPAGKSVEFALNLGASFPCGKPLDYVVIGQCGVSGKNCVAVRFAVNRGDEV
jgi:hypothetical protein